MTPDQMCVADRITAYLSDGGLFNPKLANHDAVRDLLIDAREALHMLRLHIADKNADISAMGVTRLKLEAEHTAALEEVERLKEALDAALKRIDDSNEQFDLHVLVSPERHEELCKVEKALADANTRIFTLNERVNQLNEWRLGEYKQRIENLERAEKAEREVERLKVHAEAAMSWIGDKHPDEAKQYLPDFVDAYRADKGG